jgi:hypothetical protein
MPIDTSPVNTSTTATDPATDACPYCGGASGMQSTPAPAGVQSWSCTECGPEFAVVGPPWSWSMVWSRSALWVVARHPG